jgi:hypothetical protein
MKKAAIILFTALLPALLRAQEAQLTEKPSVMISLVPQYAFQSGFRIDVDFPLNNHHWLQLAPVFYAGNNVEMSITTADKLAGIGLHAYQRFYPDQLRDHSQPYLAWGPTYQFYALDYKVRKGNLIINKHNNINRLGVDLTGGFVMHSSTFFFDFYAGAGIRQAFLSGDEETGEKFNDTFLDFGYSGVILVAGVRIGTSIKKSNQK